MLMYGTTFKSPIKNWKMIFITCIDSLKYNNDKEEDDESEDLFNGEANDMIVEEVVVPNSSMEEST